MARPNIATTFTAVDRLSKPMRDMQGRVTGFGKTASKNFRNVGDSVNSMRRMIGLATTAITVGFIGRGVKGLVSAAQSIEDATASFTPLMGSVEKATELVNRLNKEAATTPFQFEGIAGVAKQLLPVMNGSIEDTANTFRMLGDTAGGNMQKLESITRGYTKALLKGKPDMESMNMISEAGVPIFTEMAKSMGITVEQLFEMSKQGKLTTDDLTNTFKQMTSQGGLFFEGMDIASQTLSGRLSTLKDNVKLASASLGGALLPIIKDLTDRLIEVAKNVTAWINENQGLIKQKIQGFIDTVVSSVRTAIDIFNRYKGIIILVTGAIIAMKVATMAMVAAQRAALIINSIIKAYKVAVAVIALLKSGMTIATAAQWAWNAAITANPIGAIIMAVVAAVAALIAIIVLIVKNWDKITAALKVGVDKVKGFFVKLGEAIKMAFKTALDFVKKYFFTFADILLSVFGTIVRVVLEAASKLGGALGFDTTKLDNTIAKIEEVQAKVRENSFIGDAESAVSNFIGPGGGNKTVTENRQTVDVNFNNTPDNASITTRGKAPAANLNIGYRGSR